MVNLGQAVGFMLLDSNPFTGSLKAAEMQMRRFLDGSLAMDQRLLSLGGAMTSAGEGLTRSVTLPLLGAGAASSKFAMDFEESQNKVATIADASVLSIEAIGDGILDMSDQYGVAATELSESMYQAISATGDTANALGYVEVATKAAVGGYTDTATAIDGLTTVLNAYGMQGEASMQRVADQMLAAQNVGKTTFGEMAASIGDVIPIAASLDIETESLFASIATLTKNGIQTSKAITGMKAALSNILKPTGEAADLAKELGLQFDSAHLKAVGWSGFLEEVQMKTQGNSEAMATLFGSVEALNSVTVLATTGAKDYADALDEMKNSSGSLQDAFETMDQGNKDTLEDTLNSLKILGIEIGQEIAPMLSAGLKNVQGLVTGFKELDDKTKRYIISIVLMAAAVGPVLVTAGKLVTLAASLKSGLLAVNGAMTLLAANPVGIALIAVAAGFAMVIAESNRARIEAIENMEAIKRRAEEIASVQVNLINNNVSVNREAINAKYSDDIEFHNSKIRLLNEEYQISVENEEKALEASREGLQKRKKALEDAHRETLDSINEEYGVVKKLTKSKTDLVNDYYDNEIEKAREASTEKLKLIKKGLEQTLDDIDERSAEKIRALQDEIDAIDGKTEEEERIERERRNRERQEELQQAIDRAQNDDDRKEARAELNEFLFELERERILNEREAEKEALEIKISDVKDAAEKEREFAEKAAEEAQEAEKIRLKSEIEKLEEKRDAEILIIQEEREAKIKAENAKYEAQAASLENQLKSMDSYMDGYRSKLKEEIDAKIEAEKDKLEAVEKLKDEELKKLEEIRKKDEAAAKAMAARMAAEESIKSKENKYDKYYDPNFGYATGTSSAQSGFSWVGEEGPEIRFNEGGETIVPSYVSEALVSGDISSLLPEGVSNSTSIVNQFHVDQNIQIEGGVPTNQADIDYMGDVFRDRQYIALREFEYGNGR